MLALCRRPSFPCTAVAFFLCHCSGLDGSRLPPVCCRQTSDVFVASQSVVCVRRPADTTKAGGSSRQGKASFTGNSVSRSFFFNSKTTRRSTKSKALVSSLGSGRTGPIVETLEKKERKEEGLAHECLFRHESVVGASDRSRHGVLKKRSGMDTRLSRLVATRASGYMSLVLCACGGCTAGGTIPVSRSRKKVQAKCGSVGILCDSL